MRSRTAFRIDRVVHPISFFPGTHDSGITQDLHVGIRFDYKKFSARPNRIDTGPNDAQSGGVQVGMPEEPFLKYCLRLPAAHIAVGSLFFFFMRISPWQKQSACQDDPLLFHLPGTGSQESHMAE